MALPKNLPYDADTLRSRFDAKAIEAEIIEDGDVVVVETETADFLDYRDDIHTLMLHAGYYLEDAKVGKLLFAPDHENKSGLHD